MDYAGKLVVETDVDDSGIDKGLDDVESIIEEFEKKMGRKISSSERNRIDSEMVEIKRASTELDEALSKYRDLTSNKNIIFESDVREAQKLKKEIQEMLKAIEKLTGEKITIKGINDTSKNAKQNAEGIKNAIKAITKWGLALIGVSSVFSLIRSGISTLSQYDKGMASDIEYMRWALATSIKPIIEWLIKSAYTLLNILNAVIFKLFGINLFANATAKDFQKAKNSANDLKKTLAGFDEMNILNKDGTTGIATSLNFDVKSGLKSFEEFKEKLKKIDWEEVAREIAEKITKTLTSTEFWSGVWDTLLWIIRNVFVFPANFLNDIVANLFSNETTKMDSNGNLIKEEKTFAEKLVGRFVGAYIESLNVMFNPVGWIISKFQKADFEEIKEKGKQFAKGFIDGFLNGFTLYTIFRDTITQIIQLWNSTIGKLTGKTITIDIKYNKPQGMGGRAKGGIYYSPLPALAVGGIINQPGRGVPYHGARIGERGAEAVVPLTDSQQMELLGQTIGRYITINATIPVMAYNREVDRQIKIIKAEDSFAGNR